MSYSWGLVAPVGTPIAKSFPPAASRASKRAFSQQVAVAVPSTPQEMSHLLEVEISICRKVIVDANVSIN
jgi:hypothetical protein